MKFTSQEVVILPSNTATAAPLTRRHFIGDSDTRVIMSIDEAALIPLGDEQKVQMKSKRRLGVISGEPRDARAHAAKSSTAQARCKRRHGVKYTRASHRRRRTAAKLTTFTTFIRRFMKAYAILRQKLYASLSEHTFDHGDRVLGSRVATHLDIRDRVSMQSGRLSQVPEPSNSAQHAPPRFVHFSEARGCDVVACDNVTALSTMSPKQGGIQ
jgi:hypothetical protein